MLNSPLRILHITPSYKPAYHYGGPIFSVSRLAEEQVKTSVQVHVYTTTANGPGELDVSVGKNVDIDGVQIWYFSRWTGDHGHFSPALLWKLWRTIREFDVVHIHSWWNWVTFGAVFICHLRRVKPVLSPHGMISTYTIKGAVRRLFQRTIGSWLFEGAVLHATSNQEAREAMKVAPHGQYFIEPNIINLPDAPDYRMDMETAGFQFLFMSRVHPKKGLDFFLKALPGIEQPWRLTVAGDGNPDYIKQLKKLAKRLQIAEKIEWLGWIDGADKLKILAQKDLLVLTSHNENFANVILESLALGTPVLVSDQVGLSDYVAEHQLGWVCRMEVAAIRQALQSAMENRGRREQIRAEAPGMVRADFNPQTIVHRYLNQYQSFL